MVTQLVSYRGHLRHSSIHFRDCGSINGNDTWSCESSGSLRTYWFTFMHTYIPHSLALVKNCNCYKLLSKRKLCKYATPQECIGFNDLVCRHYCSMGNFSSLLPIASMSCIIKTKADNITMAFRIGSALKLCVKGNCVLNTCLPLNKNNL